MGDIPAQQLKEKLAPMMEYVRFPLISGKDLAEEVAPLGIVADDVLLEAFAAKFQNEPVAKEPAASFRFQMRSGYRRVVIHSEILDEAMKTTLGEMLPMNRLSEISFRLVHDSTRGRDAASFDQAVRG